MLLLSWFVRKWITRLQFSRELEGINEFSLEEKSLKLLNSLERIAEK